MGKREVAPVVELADIKQLDNTGFLGMVLEYRTNHLKQKSAEAAKERLSPDIHALMIATKQMKVGVEDVVAVVCNGRSGAKLDVHKLIEKGVDPDVIEACWEGGKVYQYVQVRARGEEDKYAWQTEDQAG